MLQCITSDIRPSSSHVHSTVPSCLPPRQESRVCQYVQSAHASLEKGQGQGAKMINIIQSQYAFLPAKPDPIILMSQHVHQPGTIDSYQAAVITRDC